MKGETIEELPSAIEADATLVREPRRYEIGYFLVPIIAVEQVAAIVETLIRGPITVAGGEILGGEEPKLIPLMYSIRKTIDNKNLRFKEGYFASLRFTVLPDRIAVLDQAFRLSPSLLRFLIVESPAEIEEPRRRLPESVLPLIPTLKDSQPVAPAMSQAEMDREIDELLVPTP